MIERIGRVDLRFLAACILAAVLLVTVVLEFAQLLFLLALGAVGAVGVGMVWWSRQPPPAAGDPAYAPVGLPAIPEPPEPSGQWLSLLPDGLVRPFASELCPYCQERMSPLPTLQASCAACGGMVYVRMGPDGARYLLQEVDLPTMATVWATADPSSMPQASEVARAHREALLVEAWKLTFAAAPGARYVDLTAAEVGTIVGDGRYQAVLASVGNVAKRTVRRRDVVSVLVPEPENRYDSNAVRVEVFGRLVGYVRQPMATEMAPILLRLRNEGLGAACQAEIIGGERERAEDRLALAIELRLIHPARWPELLAGKVAIRTRDLPPFAEPEVAGQLAMERLLAPRST